MSKQQFILCDEFGCKSLLSATVDNAMTLYKNVQQYFDTDIKEGIKQYQDKDSVEVRLCNPKTMIRAIVDVLNNDVGSRSESLRFIQYGPLKGKVENRPPSFVQEEWKKEAAVWILPYLYERNITFSGFESVISNMVYYKKVHPETELNFLKAYGERLTKQKPIRWVYPDLLDTAETAYVIENNKWSERATESGKIIRILEIVNQYSHRDERYSLIDVNVD